uniref:Uncharacterized protein n=1 Tax=Anguilla anguilla TaxID=7936 RepID=A0A0E9T1W4_ANGAN
MFKHNQTHICRLFHDVVFCKIKRYILLVNFEPTFYNRIRCMLALFCCCFNQSK